MNRPDVWLLAVRATKEVPVCWDRTFNPGEMAVSQENSKPRLEEVEATHGGQAAASEDAWDEERIEKGLKILKEMHIQAGSI